MIANRFLIAVCVLVGLAIVPTIIHSYSDSTVRDGKTTAAIAESLAGYSSRKSDRNATWGQRRFESDDWIERHYGTPAESVRLTVVRSFDPKSLYHHPELAVAYGPSWMRSEVKRFPSHPDVPVHMLYTDKDGGTMAMYVLMYENRFVDNPYIFQIRTSTELLFSGRKAMTLFFVTDQRAPVSADFASRPAGQVLFAAIDDFVANGRAAVR